jgi:ABC-2 type transport system ATP-binding protein
VDGLSFEIPAGQVVGFIGANGAGKTTTMRMMATLDVPDRGRIRIGGHDVVLSPDKVREQVGWMPDKYGAYDYMSVWEYLDFFARAFGYRGEERKRRVDDVMAFTDLGPLAERPCDKLSKGQGQRLCLGRTLLHDPQILILDEPAAGLDPKARIEFKRLVRLLAEAGKTLFISSHILSELEEMCDAMLFIDAGRLVHLGSSESLKYAEGSFAFVVVSVSGDAARLLEWAAMVPGVELAESRRTGARLKVADPTPDNLAALLRRLVTDGFPVVEFRREEMRLEDAFVNILNRQNGGAAP